ncbi:uncharacterized protein EI97DRAFT_437303 [Westerdykella ornata]|uniref:LYR motif-containing protein Cup1-like N-terminal domain-containing protein n=1 Tax=Westerdykella ornata TaxID=318751 RepID=A0A6A6J6K0_WESOR|nr:uncharacterized protein EI97DRAFT_437303 [Westerdykella ornata]KAF2272022.1 hypothetical protein EI97DRAFT_437303 [Westerdykella ornata]
MSKSFPNASQLKSLHLLRALLREASYLPDPTARSYFRRYIVGRFKAYQPTQNATSLAKENRRSGFKRRPITVIESRTADMQKKAEKGLNYLRRANMGERSCLRKVLLHTYGRIGRRRYALLDDLIKPEPPVNSEAQKADPEELAPLQKLYYSDRPVLRLFDSPKKVSDRKVTFSLSAPYSRLQAVITGQVQKGAALHALLRKTKLETDIYNVWERPMPIKRARNNIKRWYKDTMEKLLPPLPNAEWDHLKALATGEARWSGIVPRRTPAIASTQTDDRFVSSQVAIQQAIALDKPTKADKRAELQSSTDSITARTMRRLYAEILSYCCKLEWDDTRSGWVSRWASTVPPVFSCSVDDALFSGVDEKGRQPKLSAARNAGKQVGNTSEANS